MIRLILTGGLGNQMFEYAAAKSLALKLNKKLTVDLYALNKKTQGTKRNLGLDVFNLELTISTNWKTRFLVKAFPLVDKNRKIFEKHFGYFRDQSAINFTPKFETLQGNTILHGHFQNQKYFEKYTSQIKNNFTFKEPLTGKNLELADKVENCNSVSIHIRRGDYLTDNQAKNNFAVCSKEYYQEAINRLAKRVETPHFFVFSENFEWIKDNINFENYPVEFIDWNLGNDSYRDMQLMSLCKHNIIANSSFSWWSAWLNSHDDKSVIAPSQWFKEETRNKDLDNFYPNNWETI